MLLNNRDLNSGKLADRENQKKLMQIERMNNGSSFKNQKNIEKIDLEERTDRVDKYAPSKVEGSISKAGVILPKASHLYLENYLSQPALRIGQAYLEQALLYFEAGQLSKAITVCQKALAIHPDLADAYKILGNCLQKQGKIAEAFGQYAKALELNPDLAEVYSNIGSLLARKKKWNKAINYLQQALSINPRIASIHRNLARVWSELHDEERAEEHLLQAIALEPEALTAQQYLELAAEFESKGKQPKAIICYDYAIEQQPRQQQTYVKIIELLEHSNRWQEANQYYRRLLTLKNTNKQSRSEIAGGNRIRRLLALPPQKEVNVAAVKAIAPEGENPLLLQLPASTARKNSDRRLELDASNSQEKSQHHRHSQSVQKALKLGNLYASKKQWQQAIDCYRQAIELKPKSIEPYFRLANLYCQIEEPGLSTDVVYEIYCLKPNSFAARKHFALGNVLLDRNQVEKAKVCYRQALKLDAGFAEARTKLARLAEVRHNTIESTLIVAENSETAKQTRSNKPAGSTPLKPTKSNPDPSSNYLTLAKSAEQKQDWKLAVVCYRQAIEISPDNWQAFFRLGNVLTQLKRYGDAVKAYKIAIELHSEHFLAFHHLGEALIELERWLEAGEAFESAIRLKSDFSWSHYKLAITWIKLGQKEKAAEELRCSIELNPNFNWAYHQLGDVLTELEYLDDAVEAYRQALKITPNLPKTAEKLNDVLRQRAERDRQQVESYYKTAAVQEPERESLHYKILELNPDDVNSYVSLARINEANDKQDIAIAFYKIALQIEPNNQEVLAALEKLKS